MSWTEAFAVVVAGASGSSETGRAMFEAEFEAELGGREPPAREFAELGKSDDGSAVMTRGLAWARHASLLAGLDLREREPAITVVQLAPDDVAIASEGASEGAGDPGVPLLVVAELPAILANTALLDAWVGRELILVGDAGSLLRLSEQLGERRESLKFIHVLVSQLPVLSAAAKLLEARYGCSVGTALCDSSGAPVALAAHHGDLLRPILPAWVVDAVDLSGARIEGDWGLLEFGNGSQRQPLGHWGRRRHDRAGRAGIEVGVFPGRLEARDQLQLTVEDLHTLLMSLPVFAYTLRLVDPGRAGEGEGSRLTVSTSPEVPVATAEAAITEAIERGLDSLAIEFVGPGVEFDGLRVDDLRHGLHERVVSVVWAGRSHGPDRRAAWTSALVHAGVDGREGVRLLDGASGEPCVDPSVTEAFARLRARASSVPTSPLAQVRDRQVFVGLPDPQLECYGDGWIIELSADSGRDAMLIAGRSPRAVGLVAALFEHGTVAPELAELSVNGIHMQPYTRPTLAAGRWVDEGQPFVLDLDRCDGNGDCVRVCPTRAIALIEQRPVIDADACIRCHLCSERCEQAALRPVFDADAHVDGRTLIREASRLVEVRRRDRGRALAGKLLEPPASLDRRRAPASIRRKPTVVLGLATVTLMEHAAALLIDGELVAGVEEERLARVRHYRFEHPDQPGASLSSEPCMRVEDAWPRRSIDAVLRTAGLSMDDVDVVAINGIPARFRHSFAGGGGGGWRPPPVLRANSMVYVPHHMAHAASAYGLSGFDDAWILSIDGRGDYETATIWRAEGHALEIVDAVPWVPDRSFGGVYETATRVLGFGSHGQGSTMALAALGEPTVDVSDCLGITDDGVPVLSEWNAEKRFAPYQRGYDDPLTEAHQNLAASVQHALERTVSGYLRRHAGDLRGHNLGICGGVALNCRMNGTLRAEFEPANMHVPPGANDAGTAIGAALIGHRELTGELPRLDLGHTHLGPAWPDEAIARSLERMRVPFQRLREVGAEAAQLLAAGKIVCWFQGPMEYGPRALGGRSILADPRREDLKARLNAMKSRQSWRPFGSSVLAGRQGEWFCHDWDSRFMLFAVDVRPEKRAEIPVVVHADGSTRPQVVHREQHPRYWELIHAFDALTGVPMVVNTSFNRGGEPIVCNPAEALRSFAGLGADAIVLGDCLVRRELLGRR